MGDHNSLNLLLVVMGNHSHHVLKFGGGGRLLHITSGEYVYDVYIKALYENVNIDPTGPRSPWVNHQGQDQF